MSEHTQYTHDIFISYSHINQEWVRGELLPQLEAAGLKVIIDYRDFEIGTPSLLNMERAVATCRHTLVVLTSAWLASEWANFESFLVAARDPAGRQRKILPLRLERCTLPPRLDILAYADFTNPAEHTREMERLIRSITSHATTTYALTSERPVKPVERHQELSASERVELAELLCRSGRAIPSARRALCLEIEIEPNTLDFLDRTTPHDFAIELISSLHQTGKSAAMLRLCDAIVSMLGGPLAATLAKLRAKLT